MKIIMKQVIGKSQILVLAMVLFCTTAFGQTMSRDSMNRKNGSTTQGTYDRNGRIVGNDSTSTGRMSRGGTMMTDTMRRGRNGYDNNRGNSRMEGDTTGRKGGMNYGGMNKKNNMKKDPMKKNNKMKSDSAQ
jgi:hypothetical protein